MVSKHSCLIRDILKKSSVEFGNKAVSFPFCGFAVCLKLSNLPCCLVFPLALVPTIKSILGNFSPQH